MIRLHNNTSSESPSFTPLERFHVLKHKIAQEFKRQKSSCPKKKTPLLPSIHLTPEAFLDAFQLSQQLFNLNYNNEGIFLNLYLLYKSTESLVHYDPLLLCRDTRVMDSFSHSTQPLQSCLKMAIRKKAAWDMTAENFATIYGWLERLFFAFLSSVPQLPHKGWKRHDVSVDSEDVVGWTACDPTRLYLNFSKFLLSGHSNHLGHPKESPYVLASYFILPATLLLRQCCLPFLLSTPPKTSGVHGNFPSATQWFNQGIAHHKESNPCGGQLATPTTKSPLTASLLLVMWIVLEEMKVDGHKVIDGLSAHQPSFLKGFISPIVDRMADYVKEDSPQEFLVYFPWLKNLWLCLLSVARGDVRGESHVYPLSVMKAIRSFLSIMISLVNKAFSYSKQDSSDTFRTITEFLLETIPGTSQSGPLNVVLFQPLQTLPESPGPVFLDLLRHTMYVMNRLRRFDSSCCLRVFFDWNQCFAKKILQTCSTGKIHDSTHTQVALEFLFHLLNEVTDFVQKKGAETLTRFISSYQVDTPMSSESVSNAMDEDVYFFATILATFEKIDALMQLFSSRDEAFDRQGKHLDRFMSPRLRSLSYRCLQQLCSTVYDSLRTTRCGLGTRWKPQAKSDLEASQAFMIATQLEALTDTCEAPCPLWLSSLYQDLRLTFSLPNHSMDVQGPVEKLQKSTAWKPHELNASCHAFLHQLLSLLRRLIGFFFITDATGLHHNTRPLSRCSVKEGFTLANVESVLRLGRNSQRNQRSPNPEEGGVSAEQPLEVLSHCLCTLMGSFGYLQLIASALSGVPCRIDYMEMTCFFLQMLKWMERNCFLHHHHASWYFDSLTRLSRMLIDFSQTLTEPWDMLDRLFFTACGLCCLRYVVSKRQDSWPSSPCIAVDKIGTQTKETLSTMSFFTFLFQAFKPGQVEPRKPFDGCQVKESRQEEQEDMEAVTCRGVDDWSRPGVKDCFSEDLHQEFHDYVFRTALFLRQLTHCVHHFGSHGEHTEEKLREVFCLTAIHCCLGVIQILSRSPRRETIFSHLVAICYAQCEAPLNPKGPKVPLVFTQKTPRDLMETSHTTKENHGGPCVNMAVCYFKILLSTMESIVSLPLTKLPSMEGCEEKFSKDWELSPVNLINPPTLLEAMWTTLYVFSLHGVYQHTLIQIQQKKNPCHEGIFHMVYWLAHLHRYIESYSHFFQTTFSFLPLTRELCYLCRLQVVLSWSVRCPLRNRSKQILGDSRQIQDHCVKFYHTLMELMKTSPACVAVNMFLIQGLTLVWQTVCFLFPQAMGEPPYSTLPLNLQRCVNFLSQLSPSWTTVEHQPMLERILHEENAFLDLSSRSLSPDNVSSDTDLSRVFHHATDTWRFVFNVSSHLQQCLIERLFIPYLLPKHLWIKKSFLSVDFWLTGAIPTGSDFETTMMLWTHLCQYLTLAHQLNECFHVGTCQFVWTCPLNSSTSAPFIPWIIPLARVALTSPLWLSYLRDEVKKAYPDSVVQWLSDQQSILCLELSSYLFDFCKVLYHQSGSLCQKSKRERIIGYARDWEALASQLADMLGPSPSVCSQSSVGVPFERTPRRHAQTHHSSALDNVSPTTPPLGRSEYTSHTYQRLQSKVLVLRLEISLFSSLETFLQFYQQLVDGLHKQRNQQEKLKLSTLDTIRVLLCLSRFYIYQNTKNPRRWSQALHCATEAFMECSFLYTLNESPNTVSTWFSHEIPCHVFRPSNQKDLEPLNQNHPSSSHPMKPHGAVQPTPVNPSDYTQWSLETTPPPSMALGWTFSQSSTALPWDLSLASSGSYEPWQSFTLQHASESRNLFLVYFLYITAGLHVSCLWCCMDCHDSASKTLWQTLQFSSQRVVIMPTVFSLVCHILYLSLHPLDQPSDAPMNHHASSPAFMNPLRLRHLLRCVDSLLASHFPDTRAHPFPHASPSPLSHLMLHAPVSLLLCKSPHPFFNLAHELRQLLNFSLGRFSLKQEPKHINTKIPPRSPCQPHPLVTLHHLCIQCLELSRTLFTKHLDSNLFSTTLILSLQSPPQGDQEDSHVSHQLLHLFTCFFSCNSNTSFVHWPHNTVFDSLVSQIYAARTSLQRVVQDACVGMFGGKPRTKPVSYPTSRASEALHLFRSLVVASSLCQTVCVVSQALGALDLSRKASAQLLTGCLPLFELISTRFKIHKVLTLHTLITKECLLDASHHVRFRGLYFFRRIQHALLCPMTPEEDLIQRILFHHKMYICSAGVNHAKISPPPGRVPNMLVNDLSFPFEWSIIVHQVEQQDTHLRFHFWRFIPPALYKILETFCPHPPDHEGSPGQTMIWLSIQSCWFPQTKWKAMELQWKNIQNTNIHSATHTTGSIHTLEKTHHLPPSSRTRRQLEQHPLQQWWSKRFAVDQDLVQFLTEWESLTYPSAPFLSGWPAAMTHMGLDTLFQKAAHLCHDCCQPFLSLVSYTPQVLFLFIHLALRMAHETFENDLDPQLFQTLPPYPLEKYRGYWTACLNPFSSFQTTTHPLSPTLCSKNLKKTLDRFWKAFLKGPVKTLIKQFKQSYPFPSPSSSTHHEMSRALRHPTLLFLDNSHLLSYQIPWDALPALQRDSITLGIDPLVCENLYLVWKSKSFPSFDPRTARKCLVLNPSGDIPETEKAIPSFWLPTKQKKQLTLQRCTRHKTTTTCYIQTKPSPQELLNHLCQDQLYIYCGHGPGSQLLSPKMLQEPHRIAPSSPHPLTRCGIQSLIFLMGCSSVKFTLPPSGCGSQVYSLALDFLIAGAPVVIGLLWDVTDLDLDRFTLESLTSWCRSWQQYGPSSLMTPFRWGTLAYSKRCARKACYLKSITGSSCVQIGLPL